MSCSLRSLVILLMLTSTLLGACQPGAQPATPIQPTSESEAATTAPTEPPVVATQPAAAPTTPLTEPEPTVEQEGSAKLRIAFVFPGLINEGGFNQLGYAGLQLAEKELGAETTYVESIDVPDVPKNLRDYASQGYDVVVAWSGTYPAAVQQVAPDFPNVTFVTLADPGDYSENIWLVGTDWEEIYYLAGAAAGLTTTSNKLGHVLAVPIPVYSASAKAFEVAAKSVNPDVEVFSAFIGDFNDAVKAKQTTEAQIEQGADVIMSSLDLGTRGTIEAAKDVAGTKVISLMADEHEQAPDIVMGGVMTDFDKALLMVFRKIAAGEVGGFQSMDVGSTLGHLSDLHGMVSADTLTKLEEIQSKLAAGEIKVPMPADLEE